MPFFNTESLDYTDDERAIMRQLDEDYNQALSINQQWWDEANIDTRFYAGDQGLWNDLFGYDGIRQKNFYFNIIRRLVEMPCGHQRQNRKSTVAVPIENSDQQTADQLTKLLLWNDRVEQVPHTFSDAFTGAMITGMNLLHVSMDWQHDPISGDIKVENKRYNSFLIDPFFKRPDLSDCSFICTRSYLTRQACIALLPDSEEKIKNLNPTNSHDEKFPFMPENMAYDQKYLLTYDEYYYRTYRDQTVLIDRETGETLEWTGKKEDLKEYLALYPQLTSDTTRIPTVKLVIAVQGNLIYHGSEPGGLDEYPFIPLMGYYQPEMFEYGDRLQGIVRNLRSAQFLFNRHLVAQMDEIESQVNSGWIAKADSVVNPEDLYKTGYGQVIWRKKGSNPEDLSKIPPAQPSTGLQYLAEQMQNIMMSISGVNEELVGSAVDDKAGILAMMRQGAGLVTLQRLFDQADQSLKLLARKRMMLMQKNFTPGKIQRILAEEPAQEFYTKNFGKYDVAVEESFNTTTQRQIQFAQLLHLKELGVPVPSSSIIEAATLQNKNQLIEAIQAQEQQQQQQEQAQAQAAMQEQQATMQMAQARAASEMGLAHERESRIPENQALAYERIAESQSKRAEVDERRANAQEDRSDALLNKIKVIKELQEIDINELERLIRLSDYLKQKDNQETQPTMNAQPPFMQG